MINMDVSNTEQPNNALNPDVQKRRLALLSHAGYDERWANEHNDLSDLLDQEFHRTPGQLGNAGCGAGK